MELIVKVLWMLYLLSPAALVVGNYKKYNMESDSDLDYYRYHPSAVPNFLPVPINITVHQGELAKLKCHIYNLGPKLVVWRRTTEESPLTIGETTFTPDKRISIFHERIDEMKTYWDLWIYEVQPEHAGIYECSISATDIYTLNITLNVLDPVKYEPELSVTGTEYVSIKKEIKLTCNSTGSERAPQKVDWFFRGQLLNPLHEMYDRIEVLNKIPLPGRSLISTLIVSKATMDDSGNYVCRQTPKLAKGLKVHILNDHKEPNSKRGVTDKGDALSIRGGNSGVSLYNIMDVSATWTTILLTYLLRHFS